MPLTDVGASPTTGLDFNVAPVPVFRHLRTLSTELALIERAEGATPLPQHGYRVDDTALALVVVCREPRPAPNVTGLARRFSDFVLSAVQPSGLCHSRMSSDGAWTDSAASDEGWGRALQALGTAASAAPTAALQAQALAGFRCGAKARSTDLRPLAFAGIGAGEVLLRTPDDETARSLLGDAVDAMWWTDCDDDRPWPQPQLGHANGALAEAMILGGDLLSLNPALSRGLEMLAYLLAEQTRDGRLYPTSTTAGTTQLPGEVAGLVDACATAHRITSDRQWLAGIRLGWRWFLGDNIASAPMFDPATGGAWDTLDATGHSNDQGAAATVAMLSTAQHARRLTRHR